MVSIEPEQPDISAQVADKIQEIRFYISQQMWDQAKTAILDLTELAPDAPEVTELIAQVSKGQAGVTPAAVEAAPVEIEETPVAFAPIEVAEPFIAEPSCCAGHRRATSSCTARASAGPGKCSRYR